MVFKYSCLARVPSSHRLGTTRLTLAHFLSIKMTDVQHSIDKENKNKDKVIFTRNADGSALFERDGLRSALISAEDIADHERHGIDYSKPISGKKGGYPGANIYNCLITIHTHIMLPYKAAAITEWRNRGAPEEHVLSMVVCHLDDNPLNCARSNLMWAPAKVNRALMKGAAKSKENGMWSATVQVDEVNKYVKRVETEDEALHGRDALKIATVPQYMQDVVFDYGLQRPQKYVDLGYYANKEILLARASMYETKKVFRKKPICQERFVLLPKEDFPDIIKELLHQPDAVPFDSGVHCCVRYFSGKTKTYYFLIDTSDFETYIKKSKEVFNMHPQGYLQLGCDLLHVLVAGRKRGDHAGDNLVVCHIIPGNIGKLDCRSCNLRLDTQSNNFRDKGPGYRKLPHGTFNCRTTHNKKVISVNVQTESDAVFLTAWRRKNWKRLEIEFNNLQNDITRVREHFRQESSKALAARDDEPSAKRVKL